MNKQWESRSGNLTGHSWERTLGGEGPDSEFKVPKGTWWRWDTLKLGSCVVGVISDRLACFSFLTQHNIFITNLGISYSALWLHSLPVLPRSIHPVHPPNSNPLRPKNPTITNTKSSLYCPYNFWSMVKLPMALKENPDFLPPLAFKLLALLGVASYTLYLPMKSACPASFRAAGFSCLLACDLWVYP